MQSELKETSLCRSQMFKLLFKIKLKENFSVLLSSGLGVWGLVWGGGLWGFLLSCLSPSIKAGNYYELQFLIGF